AAWRARPPPRRRRERFPHALTQHVRRLQRGHARGDRRAQREPFVAEARALRALGDVRRELACVELGQLTVELRVYLGFEIRMGHLNAPPLCATLPEDACGRVTGVTSPCRPARQRRR